MFNQWLVSYFFSVALNSGTDALRLGLLAGGVRPGDEVLTSPLTFIATAEAVKLVGATPYFVDIEPDTFNMDTKKLEEKIKDIKILF